MTVWLFDGALGLLLLTLATAVLHVRRLYTSVVLFIAFGLLLALTWARLGAPDLALAEAAIGAGLTGALLLSALARGEADTQVNTTRRAMVRYFPATLLAALVSLVLLRAVWPLAEGPVILPALVNEQLPVSGVDHPVTAVLLNYRAWDTLLELVVLLLALLGVRQLQTSKLNLPRPWPLLLAWGQMLAPLALMVGGYVLWRGAFAPGGAFQAGAILAAGAVILRLCHLLPPLRWDYWLTRLLVLIGVAVFVAVGGFCAYLGTGWLIYPTAWAGRLIMIIEIAATLSIATTLTLLVVGEQEELDP
ncbi:hydrogenase subunit MbhD domain-containing protein [Cellvibrio sp. ARAG 10.3]|uniref:hydrogenase subunit MbhD domain-containing protein n=1 Tax=Cellvibrio sp. ARAG 10.3 TaxID=3451358 RepID=UPI003F486776